MQEKSIIIEEENIDNIKNLNDVDNFENNDFNHRNYTEKVDESETKLNKPEIIEEAFSNVVNSIKNINDKDLSKEIKNGYLEIVNRIERLVKETNAYFEPNKQGIYPLLSLEKRDHLLMLYQDVVDITDQFTEIKAKTESQKEIQRTSKIIQGYLSKDINALIKIKTPTAFPDVIRNGRKRTIKFNTKETKKIGANLSSRVIVKDGDSKKVFTESKAADFDKSLERLVVKYAKKFPTFKEAFLTYNNMQAIETLSLADFYIDENTDININERTPFVQKFLARVSDRSITKDLLKSNPKFSRVFYSFLNEAASIQNQKNFHDDIIGKSKDTADERNSGMSVVAELLGIGNVIVHSEPVKMVDENGKEIEGTLMDFAEGIDKSKIKPTDEIALYNENDVTITKEAKKQMADLQVLDYICGNLDRHNYNLFYKYDLSNPDEPKLVGIEGIDNDASFYTTKGITGMNNNCKMVGLKNLTLISDSIASRIMGITPSMLKVALQGLKINKDAIDNTLKRFANLQNVLFKNPKRLKSNHKYDFSKNLEGNEKDYQKISLTRVKDDEWDHINFSFVEPNKEPTFLKRMSRGAGGYADAMYKDEIYQEIFDNKIELTKYTEFSSLMLNKISALLKSTDKKEKDISSEYVEVKNAMKDVLDKNKALDFNDKPEKYAEYMQSMIELKVKVVEYLADKVEDTTAEFDHKKVDKVNVMLLLREKLEETIRGLDPKIEKAKTIPNKLVERDNLKQQKFIIEDQKEQKLLREMYQQRVQLEREEEKRQFDEAKENIKEENNIERKPSSSLTERLKKDTSDFNSPTNNVKKEFTSTIKVNKDKKINDLNKNK